MNSICLFQSVHLRTEHVAGFLDTATDEALSKETPQSGEGRAGVQDWVQGTSMFLGFQHFKI